MTLAETPELLKRFRRTSWKFQQTFVVSCDRVEGFAAEIAAAMPECESACLTLDQSVLEPKNLIRALSSRSIPHRGLTHGWSITAEGQQETGTLLDAAFRDSIDFLFVPKPSFFAIFADHDCYATFYAHTRSNLNRVAGALSRRGFEIVHGYERTGGRR